MALNKADTIEKLLRVVNTGYTHIDYDYVKSRAKLFRQLVTGEDADSLLKQFVPREDGFWFSQRLLLTQAVVSSWSESIISPFHKVGRTKPMENDIDWEEGETAEKKSEMDAALEAFNGDQSLFDYLQEYFAPMSFVDPNSFLITVFQDFEYKTEKAFTNPFFASSEVAVDYEYRNNKLMYLVLKYPFEYTVGGKKQTGERFVSYGENDAIQFSQVDNATYRSLPVGFSIQEKEYYKTKDDKVFLVEYFEPKAGEVPAIRIGYRPDLTRMSRVYDSPLSPAIPYFMKSIKTVSELDISFAFHAFPQKISYAPRCTGQSIEMGCSNGVTSTGAVCGVCKGSGLVTHTSGQDAIVLTMPRDASAAFDLSRLVHYVNVPSDAIKIQIEYIDNLETKAKRAIFNSDRFVVDSMSPTATGEKFDMDSVYDTLFPFAAQLAKVVRKEIKLTASYRSLSSGIIIKYSFPKDFKFRSEDLLLAQLASAVQSNAPTYIIQDIVADIAQLRYVDRPLELQRIRSKQTFDPFAGKTESQIMFIISSGLCSREDKVLWAEFANIFSELEEEGLTADVSEDGKSTGKTPYWFYDLNIRLQRRLINEKVQEYIELIDGQTPVAKPFSAMFSDFSNSDGNSA